MASRGSVIPLFVNQIINNKPVTVTDPNMTRFMMTIDDAVDLVLYAFKNGNQGDIFVQKAPAVTIEILAKSLFELLEVNNFDINEIGTRHGEKLYEVLLSREEMVCADDLGDYFRVPPDLRDLNYGKYTEKGEKKISVSDEYTSHNTTRLDMKDMKKLLSKLAFIKSAINGEFYEPEN